MTSILNEQLIRQAQTVSAIPGASSRVQKVINVQIIEFDDFRDKLDLMLQVNIMVQSVVANDSVLESPHSVAITSIEVKSPNKLVTLIAGATFTPDPILVRFNEQD